MWDAEHHSPEQNIVLDQLAMGDALGDFSDDRLFALDLADMASECEALGLRTHLRRTQPDRSGCTTRLLMPAARDDETVFQSQVCDYHQERIGSTSEHIASRQ